FARDVNQAITAIKAKYKALNKATDARNREEFPIVQQYLAILNRPAIQPATFPAWKASLPVRQDRDKFLKTNLKKCSAAALLKIGEIQDKVVSISLPRPAPANLPRNWRSEHPVILSFLQSLVDYWKRVQQLEDPLFSAPAFVYTPPSNENNPASVPPSTIPATVNDTLPAPTINAAVAVNGTPQTPANDAAATANGTLQAPAVLALHPNSTDPVLSPAPLSLLFDNNDELMEYTD
ncbi:hypothetical protein HDV05_008524, partial [Chytridiales sp. JEL 0842]